MGSDVDMEDYGFECSDEEGDEKDVDIENKYYDCKALLETDPRSALSGFTEVVKMEEEKGDWGFKALRQIVKLHYRLAEYGKMLSAYRETLTYTSFSISQNQTEKYVNKILHFVSKSASQHLELVQEFYQATLEAFEKAKNDRLWFKVNLNLCNVWLDMGEYGLMNKILQKLYKHCEGKNLLDDLRKSQLLEVYAVEMQMYLEIKDNKKLKQLHLQALCINEPAVSHPRIMGIIHECGGKLHMAQNQWEEAAGSFFNAFKKYDEVGNRRRIQCLKYYALVKMLMQSDISPFDSQEAKPYKNDTEIAEMTNLVAAYQCGNIREYENIIKSNRQTIMGDPFMRNYLEELSNNIRIRALLKLIRPYTRIHLSFICQELNTSQNNVEQLLATLALDHKVEGHVDQVNQIYEQKQRLSMKWCGAMDRWNSVSRPLHQEIILFGKH